MKCTQTLFALVAALTLTPAWAVDPIPVTADEAFDAVVTGTDPLTQQPAKVALVDVRSRAEYYWVGTASKVEAITLKGAENRPIAPDDGKVRLIHEGKFLEYTVNGRYQRVQVEKVASLSTKPVTVSVPYRFWDEAKAQLVLNPDFNAGIAQLAEQGVDVLIVYCKSGVRSSACIVNLPTDISESFSAIYEIDDPTGAANGFGGFEGAAYGNAYNGYAGFPGRDTDGQPTPSVSWKDSGLPVTIGRSPLTP